MDTKHEVTVKDLLEAGAHFGHQKSRWNPKMRRFIFEERGGIYIIDLAKTMQQIREAKELVRSVITQHKSVLFVGTKKPAKVAIRECAEQCDEFYVSERWLGGFLTNLSTIRASVKKLERIEKKIESAEGVTKKELILMEKDRVKLDSNLSGIRGMRKPPGLLVVVDPSREHIAVAEAKKLGIPVIALVDTNCDPDPIDCVIACNDDALKSIKLILNALTGAIMEKKHEQRMKMAREQLKKDEDKPQVQEKQEEQGDDN